MSWFRMIVRSAAASQRMANGRRVAPLAGMLVAIALLLAACGTAAAPTPAQVSAGTEAPTAAPTVVPTEALPPEPTAAPTEAPAPEPTSVPADTAMPESSPQAPVPVAEQNMPAPSVTVADQALSGNSVTIAEVTSDGPGWLVIHADAGGSPGPILGYSPVASGENRNVRVELELSAATSRLYAMLHTDAGTIGTWEFPGGPDAPVMVNGQILSPAFNLQALSGEAEVEMEDYQFNPKTLVIKVGTTVKWGNRDDVVHTTTSDTKVWDSGSLPKGEEFSFTFSEPGVYPYYCIPHGGPGGQGMSGTIVVLQ